MPMTYAGAIKFCLTNKIKGFTPPEFEYPCRLNKNMALFNTNCNYKSAQNWYNADDIAL